MEPRLGAVNPTAFRIGHIIRGFRIVLMVGFRPNLNNTDFRVYRASLHRVCTV
jgi:hypothetical protein